MDFRLLLLADKELSVIHLQWLTLTLRQLLEFWVVRVWKMSESEYFLSLFSARPGCVVNLDNIGELEWVLLL